MEAGSETTTLKGKNSLQSREIILFLLFMVLSHNKFQTSNPDLISFLQKGILIPVISGFIFLFLLSYSLVSSRLYDALKKQFKNSNSRYSVIYLMSSNVNRSLKNRIHNAILYHMNATPRYSCLKEIPVWISSEAPSSEPDSPGIIASSTHMFNKNPCL